ncbi:alpha/beta hydrolase [Nesterenkonia sp. K-15-9-6]|uniref:alpha/beta hydrolase n=1 Tax=Nesterenkonia sp. K-15-9-6 TaxID=3093918 RepID=UPI00404499D4
MSRAGTRRVGAGHDGTTPAQGESAQLASLLARGIAAGTRHTYGDRPDQHLELYGDPATAEQGIILIHGGYFRQRVDLTHARPLAAELAGGDASGRGGAVVALLEYRRAGGDGGHPRTLEDVSTAVAHCVRLWQELGMRPEGAAAPLIAGHSAGGCLALAWATHHGADLPQARVRALAPITDLIREARGGLAEGAVLDYMGALPDEAPEAYRWEDPRSRAALLPDGFDARIIHGTDDATVDIGFSRDMPLPRTELDGACHFDVIDPASPYFAGVRDWLAG